VPGIGKNRERQDAGQSLPAACNPGSTAKPARDFDDAIPF